jgi:isopenicillin-N epimerase
VTETVARQDVVGLEVFGLDPSVTHLNHGAFGCAPLQVRASATAWRDRAERNPHRFNRVELPDLITAARSRAADFLRLDAESCALVRNVSEGVSAVLASLGLAAGDEIVLATQGYGAVRIAASHWATRTGARVVDAKFPAGATDDEVVSAYAAASGPRTRIVVVDAITSPTAAVLPVKAIASAVSAPVFVDAAHAPGTLADAITDLGAAYWVGNLHKWSYTPRGSAVLWTADEVRDSVSPLVLSWQLPEGFSLAFEYPGTWDYAGWLAIEDGLRFWQEIGGWDRVAMLSDLAGQGQRIVAASLGTDIACLPQTPAPTMRLVALPEDWVKSAEDADELYEWLSTRHRVEVAPTLVDGAAYLRIAAAPYTRLDDYDRLASALASRPSLRRG